MKDLIIVQIVLFISSSKASSPSATNGKFSISDLIGDSKANLPPPSFSSNNDLAQEDIPGEPLNPDDFRSALLVSDEPIEMGTMDPLTSAGLFEGDIDNVSHDDYVRILDSAVGEEGALERNAIRDTHKKWPGGKVPYVISSAYDSRERAIIASAFEDYAEKTCVRFLPRTNQHAYVHIMKGDGCSSSVGRTGGIQTISLGNGCIYKGIVIHELMHAIGFWHEQSRHDRDSHVRILWNNIIDSMKFNFLKYDLNKIDHLGAPYDTCSVMHYSSTAFSKNHRSPTISQKYNSGCQLGQRKGFSQVDVQKINKLYQCDTSTIGITALKPIKPTSKPAKTKADCVDSNKYCPTWAKQGECEKNPAWMLKNCQISCQECKNSCADHNPSCQKWANSGECTKNSDYMKLYCLKSCGICQGKCKDENQHCNKWMVKGYCKTGSFVNYMKLRCKSSCGFC
ncbi:zinc metalloproteinase nas-6 [Lepeophtheirus salmonis]|uniref:zinc metalloproteinase nas-6 n=1 Tax=Lepeophtheirus salmonis TaxID=72036 RepID=UPI001AE3F557|nr:zinc metalloproteinase nas-4-like [Lepeophtheirus salmonis]